MISNIAQDESVKFKRILKSFDQRLSRLEHSLSRIEKALKIEDTADDNISEKLEIESLSESSFESTKKLIEEPNQVQEDLQPKKTVYTKSELKKIKDDIKIVNPDSNDSRSVRFQSGSVTQEFSRNNLGTKKPYLPHTQSPRSYQNSSRQMNQRWSPKNSDQKVSSVELKNVPQPDPSDISQINDQNVGSVETKIVPSLKECDDSS